jgi:hypothetical protein
MKQQIRDGMDEAKKKDETLFFGFQLVAGMLQIIRLDPCSR